LRIFKTKGFARFAKSERIPDRTLVDAVERTRRGLVDADLGGGVIKQRLARQGQGKSGGFWSIVLFRRGSMAIFAYGFAKSGRENIEQGELKAFRKLAQEMLALDDKSLAAAIRNGTITEIICHEEEISQ